MNYHSAAGKWKRSVVYNEKTRRRLARDKIVINIAAPQSNVVKMTNGLDKQWIANHCFTKDGKRLNSRIIQRSWWINRKYNRQLNLLENLGRPLFESIWLLYNEQSGPPCCKTCNGPVKFVQFSKGYREYCSVFCATHGADRNYKLARNHDYKKSQEKAKSTNLIRYGAEQIFASDTFKRKSADTKRKRYGDAKFNNPSKNKQTCLTRYGVEFLFDSPEVQKKCLSSKLKLYGGCFPGIDSHSNSENDVRKLFEETTGCDFPSKIGVLSNGKELDGYNSDLKIAFEYCGLYCHREDVKPRWYHRQKLDECRKLGIRLYTIFEDEWIHRNKQVRNYIQASLGFYNTRLAARNCLVDLFSRDNKQLKSVAQQFLEDHHIQGASQRSHTWITLRTNSGELLGVMSFSDHHRQGHKHTLILNRLAFKDGVQVLGGASRMFSHAIRLFGPQKTIVSWSDNRWSEGNVYQKMGFELADDTFADYSYIGKHRSRIPKQSMQKKLIGCPHNMTEREFCKNVLGLDRIWDCGKRRYTYNKQG